MLREGATSHYISEQEVPYLVKGDQWVGYDDPHSLQLKVAIFLCRYSTNHKNTEFDFKYSVIMKYLMT